MVVDVSAGHAEFVARDGHGGYRLCHVGVEAEEQLSLLGVSSHFIATRGKYLLGGVNWVSILFLMKLRESGGKPPITALAFM